MAAKAATQRPGRRGNDPEEVRARILSAFSEKAKRAGIRSIVMAELAGELRMSATTLYNHFPSKEDLVLAVVEQWAREVAQTEAALPGPGRPEDAVKGLLYWAEAWSKSLAQFASAFWDDLKRDHPQAFDIFRERLREQKRMGAGLLRPFLRPELHPDMALETLNILLNQVPNPRLCERVGISRRDAIQNALTIWAKGALVSSKASVHPIRT